MTNKISQAVLQLRIAMPSAGSHSLHLLPLQVTFRNIGDAALRILDQFEPIPVFFSFNIVYEDGTPIPIAGGGKIDLPSSMKNYITLLPSEHAEIRIDLERLLPGAIKTGTYQITALYHNQYGEHCFIGSIRSNTITVDIVSAP
jgi:hypothetical protein